LFKNKSLATLSGESLVHRLLTTRPAVLNSLTRYAGAWDGQHMVC